MLNEIVLALNRPRGLDGGNDKGRMARFTPHRAAMQNALTGEKAAD